jgi:hypothetical protein
MKYQWAHPWSKIHRVKMLLTSAIWIESTQMNSTKNLKLVKENRVNDTCSKADDPFEETRLSKCIVNCLGLRCLLMLSEVQSEALEKENFLCELFSFRMFHNFINCFGKWFKSNDIVKSIDQRNFRLRSKFTNKVIFSEIIHMILNAQWWQLILLKVFFIKKFERTTSSWKKYLFDFVRFNLRSYFHRIVTWSTSRINKKRSLFVQFNIRYVVAEVRRGDSSAIWKCNELTPHLLDNWETCISQ